jgi:GNAT superfamily N-acetyltransferase
MTISVRLADTNDLATLVDFNIAMAVESEEKALDPAVLRRGIEAVLDDANHGLYLVAETEGHAAGTLMVTWEWSDWRNGRFWWIQSVFVSIQHRRCGVYRRLHDHVRSLARDDPTSCGLRLYVEHENTGARATYQMMEMEETPYRLYEQEWSRR